MNLKRTALLSLSSVAVMIGGAGAAQAGDGPKYVNNQNVLSCLSLEVLDVPILSSANNNIDCSNNYDLESNEVNDHRSGGPDSRSSHDAKSPTQSNTAQGHGSLH